MDTTSTTVNPTTVAFPKVRVKHALSYGICKGTESAVRVADSAANIVEAVAVRIKLHNISTAADIIDELGNEKVTQAQQLISKL